MALYTTRTLILNIKIATTIMFTPNINTDTTIHNTVTFNINIMVVITTNIHMSITSYY